MAKDMASTVDQGGESVASWLALARAKAEEQAADDAMDCDMLRELPLRGEDDEDLVKQSFVLAFYFLLRHGNGCSYEHAVRETIRLGDETDTNACIVGGLLGAAVGIDDVPEDLRIKVLGFDSASKSLLKPKRRRPEFLSVKRNFHENVKLLVERRARGRSVQIKQP